MSALTGQVGGDHYRNKAIQPVQFSMANGLDACAHSILKYVTRHREKNGRQDLEKALHFVDLRMELGTAAHRVGYWHIGMHDYCYENHTPEPECEALHYLSFWLSTGEPEYAQRTKDAIHTLITAHYSTGE